LKEAVQWQSEIKMKGTDDVYGALHGWFLLD